jgi:hypothetical protein
MISIARIILLLVKHLTSMIQALQGLIMPFIDL